MTTASGGQNVRKGTVGEAPIPAVTWISPVRPALRQGKLPDARPGGKSQFDTIAP